jgi:Rps23 Pro-64 3,4-dihydroxylase Tpa1-like proline 4-hydroxylase
LLFDNLNPREYQEANPFPHTVVDDFVEPKLLKRVLKEWPFEAHPAWYKKQAETSIKYSMNAFDAFGPNTQQLIIALNSQEFLSELERVTGIDGLLADPSLEGGGLHMIPRGGFLKMHADFNWHYTGNVMRKINLLLYLNEDWQKDWGGDLQLIGPPSVMDTNVLVAPQFNRCVVFNTTSDSWHGHPKPMTTPASVMRKSIALYYYRVEPAPEHKHSTIYREDLENAEFKNTIIYL